MEACFRNRIKKNKKVTQLLTFFLAITSYLKGLENKQKKSPHNLLALKPS